MGLPPSGYAHGRSPRPAGSVRLPAPQSPPSSARVITASPPSSPGRRALLTSLHPAPTSLWNMSRAVCDSPHVPLPRSISANVSCSSDQMASQLDTDRSAVRCAQPLLFTSRHSLQPPSVKQMRAQHSGYATVAPSCPALHKVEIPVPVSIANVPDVPKEEEQLVAAPKLDHQDASLSSRSFASAKTIASESCRTWCSQHVVDELSEDTGIAHAELEHYVMQGDEPVEVLVLMGHDATNLDAECADQPETPAGAVVRYVSYVAGQNASNPPAAASTQELRGCIAVVASSMRSVRSAEEALRGARSRREALEADAETVVPTLEGLRRNEQRAKDRLCGIPEKMRKSSEGNLATLRAKRESAEAQLAEITSFLTSERSQEHLWRAQLRRCRTEAHAAWQAQQKLRGRAALPTPCRMRLSPRGEGALSKLV